jgi:hypothetical protein
MPGAGVLFLGEYARMVESIPNSLKSADDYPLVMTDQKIAASFSDVMDECARGPVDNSFTGAGR